MKNTIEQMTAGELAEYIGQDATEADGQAMQDALIKACFGGRIVEEICDTEWMKALRVVTGDAKQ